MKPRQYEFGKVENSAHIYIDMTGKNLGKISVSFNHETQTI